jgi:hypothetical protein
MVCGLRWVGSQPGQSTIVPPLPHAAGSLDPVAGVLTGISSWVVLVEEAA